MVNFHMFSAGCNLNVILSSCFFNVCISREFGINITFSCNYCTNISVSLFAVIMIHTFDINIVVTKNINGFFRFIDIPFVRSCCIVTVEYLFNTVLSEG